MVHNHFPQNGVLLMLQIFQRLTASVVHILTQKPTIAGSDLTNAQDYLMKPVTTERMSKTLDRIRRRHRHETVRPSDSYSALPAEERSEQVMLTEQETRVVRLITDGFSNKEMADHLNITTETVKFHLKNVYRKLNVNNRVQVLQRVKELNKRI